MLNFGEVASCIHLIFRHSSHSPTSSLSKKYVTYNLWRTPSPKKCWERTSSYITTVYHFMWPKYNISPTWISLKWEISLTKPPFGVRCEVAIIWPDSSHFLTLNSWEASLARAMLPALVLSHVAAGACDDATPSACFSHSHCSFVGLIHKVS